MVITNTLLENVYSSKTNEDFVSFVSFFYMMHSDTILGPFS